MSHSNVLTRSSARRQPSLINPYSYVNATERASSRSNLQMSYFIFFASSLYKASSKLINTTYISTHLNYFKFYSVPFSLISFNGSSDSRESAISVAKSISFFDIFINTLIEDFLFGILIQMSYHLNIYIIRMYLSLRSVAMDTKTSYRDYFGLIFELREHIQVQA